MWRVPRLALGAILTCGVAAQTSAESLDLAEMGAALALPVITGGYPGNAIEGTDGDGIFGFVPPVVGIGAATLNTITNGSMNAIVLRVDVISGDPNQTGAGAPFDNDGWESTSFDCPLTAFETVTFLFLRGPEAGRTSTVYAECSGTGIRRFLNTGNGIHFVAAADATGASISQDVIFGDSVVIDLATGAAVSVSAVSIQAGAGANDGDKVYAFDGLEYAEFPALVATNFLAPSPQIVAELILFTLDGTTGRRPVPSVALTGVAYNDDEVPFDFQYEFDCFDIVQLQQIDPNLSTFGLLSPVGHLQLRSQPMGRGFFDAHDAKYGDSNSIRTAPALGWLAQAVGPAGPQLILPPNSLGPNPAVGAQVTPLAWARPLSVSRAAAMPFLGDDPATLDAQP